MLGLTLEKIFWDKKRKVRVFCTRVSNRLSKTFLHTPPNIKTIRPNNHHATHGRVIGQLGFENDVVIPGVNVFFERCYFFGHAASLEEFLNSLNDVKTNKITRRHRYN